MQTNSQGEICHIQAESSDYRNKLHYCSGGVASASWGKDEQTVAPAALACKRPHVASNGANPAGVKRLLPRLKMPSAWHSQASRIHVVPSSNTFCLEPVASGQPCLGVLLKPSQKRDNAKTTRTSTECCHLRTGQCVLVVAKHAINRYEAASLCTELRLLPLRHSGNS